MDHLAIPVKMMPRTVAKALLQSKLRRVLSLTAFNHHFPGNQVKGYGLEDANLVYKMRTKLVCS